MEEEIIAIYKTPTVYQEFSKTFCKVSYFVNTLAALIIYYH